MIAYELEAVDLLEGLPEEFVKHGIPSVAVSDDGRIVLYDYPDMTWSAFELDEEGGDGWRRLDDRPDLDPKKQAAKIGEGGLSTRARADLIEGLRVLKVPESEIEKVSKWPLPRLSEFVGVIAESRSECVERGYHKPRQVAGRTYCRSCNDMKPPLGDETDLPWGTAPEPGDGSDMFETMRKTAIPPVLEITCPCGAHWRQQFVEDAPVTCRACGKTGGDLEVKKLGDRPAE